jgi:hypothetical protein
MSAVSWFGTLVSPPVAVASVLQELLHEPVGHVRVFEHSLFARCHGRAVATTRRRSIFLRGSGGEFFDNPWLMLHEYWHVLKQWEPRHLTLRSYAAECLRRGYWNNRFEVEARAFADLHAAKMRRLLGPRSDGSQHGPQAPHSSSQ